MEQTRNSHKIFTVSVFGQEGKEGSKEGMSEGYEKRETQSIE